MPSVPLPDKPDEVELGEETVKKMLTELMLEIELETITGTSVDFIRSLNSYFHQKGRLSPKQQFYLRKHYVKAFPDVLGTGGDGGESA